MTATAKTGNYGNAYEHSLDHLLEYFSKGGSIQKGAHYTNPENILELFKAAWYTGREEDCMKLLFWTRDCRGGAGARKNFRDNLKWLATEEPDWVKANIHFIPFYGRWDDLTALYGTPCEKNALALWAEALTINDPSVTPLAAKWADRQDHKLRTYMYLTPKAYRKLVVEKTGWVVEKSMCSGKWENIEYSKVPSVAMARYRKAFAKHNPDTFAAWSKKVATGEEKVNAGALFPHDVIRTIKGNYCETSAEFKGLMDKTFEGLPNYVEDPNVKIMPICDFSGSMEAKVSGSITAMDVSLALGLYCTSKLDPSNPFYRKLIPFSDKAELETWSNMSVVDAVKTIPNGYCGNTNIEAALKLLIKTAKFFNIPREQMVNTILVLSDMQFDPRSMGGEGAVVEECLNEWEAAGYDRPRVIYWNLAAYGNQPATKKHKNVALVSGFSPSILKATLNVRNITPIDVMMDAISKYKVVVP